MQHQFFIVDDCPYCNSPCEVVRPGLRWKCTHCNGLARECAGRLRPLFGYGRVSKAKDRKAAIRRQHEQAKQFYE